MSDNETVLQCLICYLPWFIFQRCAERLEKKISNLKWFLWDIFFGMLFTKLWDPFFLNTGKCFFDDPAITEGWFYFTVVQGHILCCFYNFKFAKHCPSSDIFCVLLKKNAFCCPQLSGPIILRSWKGFLSGYMFYQFSHL